jgi:hypothetical protein
MSGAGFDIGDRDFTIDGQFCVHQSYVLPSSPVSPRTITIDPSIAYLAYLQGPPLAGDPWIDIYVNKLNSTGTPFTIKDSGGATLATIKAPPSIAHTPSCWIRINLAKRAGGVASLGPNSGSLWDPVANAAYGVI